MTRYPECMLCRQNMHRDRSVLVRIDNNMPRPSGTSYRRVCFLCIIKLDGMMNDKLRLSCNGVSTTVGELCRS